MDAKMEDNKSELDAKDLKLETSVEDNKLAINTETEPVNKKLKLSENEVIEAKSSKEDKTESSSSKSMEITDLIQPCSSKSGKIESLPEPEKNEPSTSKIIKCESKHKENDNDDEDEEVLLDGRHAVPEEGFIYPLEMDSSDMLDETEFVFDENGHYPSITERYFTPYYQLDAQKPGDDVCIRVHSNRICMIGLAPSHTIFQENKTIESCNYKVSEKLDRSKNKVSGKAKHGAQPLQCNSNLCCLTCTDGTSYMVKCCMIGKLVEVNERLLQDPELLKLDPHYGGYIAIVLPNLKHLDKHLKEKLLDQTQYEEAIKKRKEKEAEEKEQATESKALDNKNDIKTVEKQQDPKNGHSEEGNDKEQLMDMELVEKKQTQDQCVSDIPMSVDLKELDKEQVESMEIVES